MNTTFTPDTAAAHATDFAAVELRLLAEFEITQVGGGENVAVFG